PVRLRTGVHTDGTCRRGGHAETRDPRPAGQGGRRRTASTGPDRDHRRPPGQTLRTRGGRNRGRPRPRAPRRRRGPVQSGDRGCGLGALGGGELMGRIAVVTFPGGLDDRDAARAVRLAGADLVRLWHADECLAQVVAVVVPGAFSYGDYLRAGALTSFAQIMTSLVDGANAGMPVLGICDGFEILCETHLLAG